MRTQVWPGTCLTDKGQTKFRILDRGLLRRQLAKAVLLSDGEVEVKQKGFGSYSVCKYKQRAVHTVHVMAA